MRTDAIGGNRQKRRGYPTLTFRRCVYGVLIAIAGHPGERLGNGGRIIRRMRKTLQESDIERIYAVLRDKHASALITYKELCKRAGLPHLTRNAGTVLAEIAERCKKRRLPPINSLAVNAKTRKPGGGYSGAVGCSEAGWKEEVGECLSVKKYPARIS